MAEQLDGILYNGKEYSFPKTDAYTKEESDAKYATNEEVAEKIGDAPNDGKQYARKNGEWQEVEEGGDLPIDKESTSSEEDIIDFQTDNGKSIMQVTPYGVRVEAITDMDGNPILGEGKNIKILFFGNSFTEDSVSYVPAMLKNIVPNLTFTIGVAYIGGCSLAQHCANFTREPQTIGSTTYNVVNYTYSKFKNTFTKWQTIGSKNVDFMLSDEQWDIVTFQQNGSNSFSDWDTYFEPFIHKIHKALFDKYSNKTFKLGWLLTHGTYTTDVQSQKNRWQGTADNTQKVLDYTPTDIIFPYGTAVQNLRTTPLNSAGVGGENVGFLGDTAHLHEGVGTMTANYANLITVLKCAGFDNSSIIGEPTRVSIAWNTANGTMGANYGTTGTPIVYGVTEENIYLAQTAAIMANKYPFHICAWDGKSFKRENL